MKRHIAIGLGAMMVVTGVVRAQMVIQAKGAPGMDQVTHNPSERGVVFQARGANKVNPAAATIVNTPPRHHNENCYNKGFYTSYPYYSNYSPSYWYHGGGGIYYEDVPVRTAPNNKGSEETEPFILGRDWGQDLRREIVTWEEFVAVVKSKLLRAPQADRQEFERGFTDGYGTNADGAYAKAFREATAATQEAEIRPKVIVSPFGTVEARD